MVATATLIQDTVLFIRDDLAANITDPISSTRTSSNNNGERFVMTSYPSRAFQPPVITVRVKSLAEPKRLGMQSEQFLVTIPVEIRVWARNEKEKDQLTQQVYQRMRTNEFGSGSSNGQGLFDRKLTSMVDVDEPDQAGVAGVRSKVSLYQYKFLTSS